MKGPILASLLFVMSNACAQSTVVSLDENRHAVQDVERLSVDRDYPIQLLDSGVIRFEVRPDDYAFNGNCAQIKCDTTKASYYSFEFRAPSFTYMHPEFFSIADWHLNPKVGRQNIDKGWGFRSPLALNIRDNEVSVILRPVNNGVAKRVLIVKTELKDWTQVEIWINWSSDTTQGFFKCRVNEEEITLYNIPTLYPDNKAPYFKCGIYRSGQYTDTSVVEFRNIYQNNTQLFPDFNKPPKGEGKGYKKNGIDKGLNLDLYEESKERKRQEMQKRRSDKKKED